MSTESQTEASASAAAPSPPASSVTPPAAKRMAMVVEDSMPLRRMLAKIVETQKFVVDEAEDGKVALDTLDKHPPGHYSMILCDLMMPVMDGASFIAAARKKYGEALPPVIICSSRSDREAVQVVMKLGVSGYILKPFKTETVINRIRETFPDLKPSESP